MPPRIDFDDTEVAFRCKSDEDLKASYFLFKALGYHTVVRLGPTLLRWAFNWRLPVRRPVRDIVFRQFCGGESLEECLGTVHGLAENRVKTMLDYAVEGRERDSDFDETCEEVSSAIRRASDIPAIRSCVVKLTGVARVGLLEKISSGASLTDKENREWRRAVDRVDRLCREARDSGVRVFVDAEESWIQRAIDELTLDMMAKYNREGAVVFHSVQMYRRDRLELLEHIRDDAAKRSYTAGIKLVRGAYLEKELARASRRRVPPIVHTRKEDTDRHFDDALRLIVAGLDRLSLCAATHNEDSTVLVLTLMSQNDIDPRDDRVEFSQLYGMGDHLTYNLAGHGYNTSKYVPYGPIELVLPYLARRAQENSSVHGTSGRELGLVTREMKRRGLL